MVAPSAEVVEAFQLAGDVELLRGGSDPVLQFGGSVLKRVHDEREAAWVQELLSRIEPDGFRIAAPVPAVGGGWVVDGWIASEFIPGLKPAAPSWPMIINTGVRFSEAADDVADSVGVLESRDHRWAMADRAAWDEAGVALPSGAVEVEHKIRDALVTNRDTTSSRCVIHGDLAGNVFLDLSGVPVVLDVSPYLRPRAFASAIVVVDAMLWHGADPEFARRFIDNPKNVELFGRALLFRLVADSIGSEPLDAGTADRYEQVLDAVSSL